MMIFLPVHRTTRRLSWWTMPSPFAADWISPFDAGIPPSIASIIPAGSIQPERAIAPSTTFKRSWTGKRHLRWRNWLANAGRGRHVPAHPLCAPVGDPWPRQCQARFQRTSTSASHALCQLPRRRTEIREVEALFFDAIDHATRAIYIENQFVTATRIAERLARRMRAQPALEVVVVVPKAHHSWLEAQVMRTGRIRFMQILEAAGVLDRVALLSPHVSEGESDLDVMVHSKVMIVDDVLLHVGSANLNNRSIGLDTECDLAIEARDGR